MNIRGEPKRNSEAEIKGGGGATHSERARERERR